MKWTNGDVLHAREAMVVGGPLDGLRVAVRHDPERNEYRHPDVVDLSAYIFNPESWQFEFDFQQPVLA
jgi:hypothetical protein